MKKIKLHQALFSGILLITSATYAQNNTYPFPSSGNVGIGTTNASFSKLVLQNPATANNASDNLRGLSVEKLTSTTVRRVFVIPHAGAGAYNNLTSENDAGLYWTDGANTSDNFKNISAGFVIAPWANSNAGLKILANGNTGIGVYPEAKLHVSGEARVTDPATPMLTLNSSNTSALYNFGFHFDGWGASGSNGSTPTYEVRFGKYSKAGQWLANPLRFSLEAPDGTFIVTKEGKVGIGLPSNSIKMGETNCKLFVAGGIMTEKIKVMAYATWADYVFTKEYKLTPLKEVEKFISENNHLSEIPSAREIETNGLDLAEISRLQMQKIEELTLYLIEQNKQINEQNKQLLEQSKRIDQLEKSNH